MKKTFKIIAVSLISLFSLTRIAQGGDSLSIALSVTMPAIPGVNAPLIEEETIKTQENTQNKTQEESAALIQQDSQLTTNDGQPLIIVKTLYER